jgi:RimJ/RimL family protein N-acetyltransferase
MFIQYENLTIRNAETADAEQLCAWWNDGKVMAHAEFPNGLGCIPDTIRKDIATDDDKKQRRHIIELDGKPIGEMSYRNMKGAEGTAEPGIKICDFSEQDKGLGTKLLIVFIDALFRYYSYERIVLSTNLENERAQHIYEKKLGFRRTRIDKDCWRNQLGELQSFVYFEIGKDDWFAAQKGVLEYTHSTTSFMH